MQMGIHRLDQFQVKLAHELQIAVDLFQNRIDDQGLAAPSAGDKISISAGNAVKKLAEDHRRLRDASLAPLCHQSVRCRARGKAIAKTEKSLAPPNRPDRRAMLLRLWLRHDSK